MSGKNVINKRLESIIRSGLEVERYGSIYSTTRLITNTKEQDVEKILKYAMYDSDPKVVCLFAVPKYMYVDGRCVEFSSCDGADYKLNNSNLVAAYKNNLPPPDHFKCCLLDAVKTKSSLSTKTLLAAYEINSKTGEVLLYLPRTHFVQGPAACW